MISMIKMILSVGGVLGAFGAGFGLCSWFMRTMCKSCELHRWDNNSGRYLKQDLYYTSGDNAQKLHQ